MDRFEQGDIAMKCNGENKSEAWVGVRDGENRFTS
jgi:hypothetical protein